MWNCREAEQLLKALQGKATRAQTPNFSAPSNGRRTCAPKLVHVLAFNRRPFGPLAISLFLQVADKKNKDKREKGKWNPKRSLACAQQLEGEEACEEGMCHTGFMSAAMDSWSGGFRVHAVIFPPRETRSPTVCIQKRWRRSLSTSFYVSRMRSGVGWRRAGWRGGGVRKGQTEGTPKREGRKKKKKVGTSARHGAEEDKRDAKREWEK